MGPLAWLSTEVVVECMEMVEPNGPRATSVDDELL